MKVKVGKAQWAVIGLAVVGGLIPAVILGAWLYARRNHGEGKR